MPEQPPKPAHIRVCQRCGTQFPLSQLCPQCYGWDESDETPTAPANR